MNNFSISSAGIGEALTRSAAALSAAGNSMEQSIGLVTGMNSVIQNPEAVGTALKSLTMYLRVAKTDADDAGIATDGMANSVAELREELRLLTGVDILKDNNTFKPTFQIMKELSEVWGSLTDVSQANVLNMIGGKRNANVIAALLNNFDEAEKAYASAMNSVGSAMKENEKYLDSITGKINQIKASFEELSITVMNSELVKFFLDVANAAIQVINALAKMNMLFPMIMAGSGMLFNSKIDDKAVSIAGRLIKSIVTDGKDAGKVITELTGDILSLGTDGIGRLVKHLSSAEGNLGGVIEKINKLGVSSKATGLSLTNMLKGLFSLKGIALSSGAIVGMQVISAIYNELSGNNAIKRAEELTAEFKQQTDAIDDNIEKIKTYQSRYEELSKKADFVLSKDGISGYVKQGDLSADEFDEYLHIIEEIVDISPSVITGYNNEGQALANYTSLIKEATEAQKELKEEEYKTYYSSNNSDTILRAAKTKYTTSYRSARSVLENFGASGYKLREVLNKRIGDDDGAITFGELWGIDVNNVDEFASVDAVLQMSDDSIRALSKKRREIVNELKVLFPEDIDDILKISTLLGDIQSYMGDADAEIAGIAEYYSGYVLSGLSMIDLSIPYSATDELKTGIYNIIKDAGPDKTDHEYRYLAEEYAKRYQAIILNGYKDGAKLIQSEATKQDFVKMSGLVYSGEVKIDEYTNALDEWKKANSDLANDPAFMAAVDFFDSLITGAEEASKAVDEYGKSINTNVVGLSTILGDSNKTQSIIDKANKEMAENGSVSLETVQAVSAMLGPEEKLIEYLRVENGLLVLNTKALSKRGSALIDADISAYQAQNAASIESIKSAVKIRKEAKAAMKLFETGNPDGITVMINGDEIEGYEEAKSAYESAGETIRSSTQAIRENDEAIEINRAAQVNLGASTTDTSAKFNELTKSISSTKSAYSLLSDVQKDMETYGELSADTLISAMSLFGEDWKTYIGEIRDADKNLIGYMPKDNWIDGFIEKTFEGVDGAGELKNELKALFSEANDKNNRHAAIDSLTSAIGNASKYGDAITNIRKEISEDGSNSIDTLSDLIDLSDEIKKATGNSWDFYLDTTNGIRIKEEAYEALIAVELEAMDTELLAMGVEQDRINTIHEAIKASYAQEKANKSLEDSYSSLKSAISLAGQHANRMEVTHDTLKQMIETDARYAASIEHVNGVLTINQEKYAAITQQIAAEQQLRAEQAIQAKLLDERYIDLTNRIGTLDDAEQDQLDTMNAEIMALAAMANEASNANDELTKLLNTEKKSKTTEFSGYTEAVNMVNDVLNNKKSEYYQQYGNDFFKQSVAYLFPEDIDVYSKAGQQLLKKYMSYLDKEGKLTNKFYKDIAKSGVINDKTGDLVIKNVEAAAKRMGLTEEAFEALVTQANMYQKDERGIVIVKKELPESVQTWSKAVSTASAVATKLEQDTSGLTEAQKKNAEASSKAEKSLKKYNRTANGSILNKAAQSVNDRMSVASDEEIDSVDALKNKVGELQEAVDTIKDTELDIQNGQFANNQLSTTFALLSSIFNKLIAISKIGPIEQEITVTEKKQTSSGWLSGISNIFSNAVLNLSGRRNGDAGASGISAAKGGKTLVGELGRETVVDPAASRWYTVGDNGPEFVNLPRNAIVFNADQTRELFAMGRTREHGEAMVSGNAYASGNDTLLSALKNVQNALKNVSSTSSSKTKATINASKQSSTILKNLKSGNMSGGLDSWSNNGSGSGSGGGSSRDAEEEISVLEELQKKYEELNEQTEHLIAHQEHLYKVSENGLDFKGMEASLTEQARLYKKLMSDAKEGVKEMQANGAKDSDKELQAMEEAYWSAYDSLNDVLSQINELYVNALNDKIDGIQGAFGTLQTAAKEMAESGTISTDTFQELLSNGINYMDLLDKVGDTYVINEDKVRALLAAEKEQLAVESALSYINQLKQSLMDDDANRTQNLVDLTNQVGDSTWAAVYAQAEMLKNLGLTGDQYTVIIQNIDAMRELSGKVADDLSTDASELYKKQKTAIDYILKKTEELIKYETDQKIEALEKQIDDYQEIIDLKKESLEKSREEEEYQESVADKTSEIAKIQTKLNQLALDDSREAAAKRAEYMEELKELQKELGDIQTDRSDTLTQEALDKSAEDYEKERQDKIEQLQETVSSAEKVYQLALERLENGWSTIYQELITWNTEAGNVLNSEITENWEIALAAAKQYGSYVNALHAMDDKGKVPLTLSTGELPKYHGGGIVDERGAMGDEEVLAVLKQDEMVLDEKAKGGLYKVIDFVSYLSDKLKTKIGDVSSLFGGVKNAPPALDAAQANPLQANTTIGDTVFSPTVNVTISHSGDMDDREARRLGREAANGAIDRLYETFKQKGIGTTTSNSRLRT